MEEICRKYAPIQKISKAVGRGGITLFRKVLEFV